MLLWLAPLPIGSNTADVAIDLELVDRTGQVVWRHAPQDHGCKGHGWLTGRQGRQMMPLRSQRRYRRSR